MAAGVKTHYERRERAGWDEGSRTVDIANRLRYGLAHVRARMERQLQQPHVLDRLRFNRLNAGDVEKMVFVVVDKIAFHLRRGHSTERLRDVNHRQIQVRKNIDRHSQKSKNRTQGYSDHDYDDPYVISKRAPQQPHG